MKQQPDLTLLEYLRQFYRQWETHFKDEQINTINNYKQNLAYDYIALALLCSERLRLLTTDNPSLPELLAQFENYYNTGFGHFAELGQIVDKAEKALDIARAYTEVSALENLERAEELAQQSLQVFLEFNRQKLEAEARKLLDEIYRQRA